MLAPKCLERQTAYGCEIWYTDLNSHGIKRLKSLQLAGLLTILKTYKIVSTVALCVVTGIIISNSLKYTAKCYVILINNEVLTSEHRSFTENSFMK